MDEEKNPNEKTIEKIRKLLALGESSSEAEANAAIAKAHELLKMYNLELSDISEKQEIEQKIIEDGGRQKEWRRVLMTGVSGSCYCAFITQRRRDGYHYRLYGRSGNIKTAEIMYQYLIDTIKRLCEKTYIETGKGISKAEYCFGMAVRISERLQETIERELEECTALVPVSTEADEFAKKDCNPVPSKNRSKEPTRSMMIGYQHGNDVQLSRQIKGQE